jgi:hypothetical protein
MTNKIAVEPAKASELMAQGYTIECYLILPEPTRTTHKKAQKIASTVWLSLGLKGTEPMLGKIGEVWPKVKMGLLKGDPTRKVTRKDAEAFVVKNGGTKNHVSQFIHAYKCLRVVD